MDSEVLALLRLHAIRRIEVFSGMSNELRVAWMIDGFHSDDHVHQFGIVVMNVLDQLRLCIGWSGNENCTGVRNRFGNFVKIVVIFPGVPVPNGVCLMMDVPGRMLRVQNVSFDICRTNMKHARFMVVDPNDGMIVMLAHGN
jgi:hypothetical protein